MNHSNRRKLRNRFRAVTDRLSFNFLHLKPSGRIVVVGAILSAVSLFFPWFSLGGAVSWTAFSLSLGYVGYVRLAVLAMVALAVFSHRTKSELKSRSGFAVSDYALWLFSAVAFLAADFVCVNVVRWFSVFQQGVALGNGPALSVVGTCFIAAGAAIGYREHKRELYETTFVENSRTTTAMLEEYEAIIKKADPDKKNMSLPV